MAGDNAEQSASTPCVSSLKAIHVDPTIAQRSCESEVLAGTMILLYGDMLVAGESGVEQKEANDL